MRIEYIGNILDVRAVEDSIRATRKYTKGAFSYAVRHPIQGEEFPSKTITEYYEVYPDIDMDERMPLWDAIMTFSDWIWGETPHIDLRFLYCYPENKGRIIIFGNDGVVGMLKESIPNFSQKLSNLRIVEKGENKN